MPRIDLRVPFPEKEAARHLGARWDPRRRVWYVPDGVNAEPLRGWVPVSQSPDIRATRYFLATATRECWHCHAPTPVHAIVLPAEHEVQYIEDDPADDHWGVVGLPAVLSYISDLAEPIAAQLRALAPQYYMDCSHTMDSFYWINHCEHCNAKLGDHDNHSIPGVAFWPMTSAAEAAIQLREINEPFAAACGYTHGKPLGEGR